MQIDCVGTAPYNVAKKAVLLREQMEIVQAGTPERVKENANDNLDKPDSACQ